MSYEAEKMAQRKCEEWACWNELTEQEKEETFDGYMDMYELGKLEALLPRPLTK